MDEAKVLEHRIVEGVAEARFEDGFYLQIVPYHAIKEEFGCVFWFFRFFKSERKVMGFDSALLFNEKGALQAAVIDRKIPEGSPLEHSGFSSKYGVEQKELARYWNAAIQACEHLSEEQELYIIMRQGWDIKQRLEQNKEKAF